MYNITAQVVSIRKITLMEWGVLGAMITSPGAPDGVIAKELGIPQIEFVKVIHNQLMLLDLVNQDNEVTDRGRDLYDRELMESESLDTELEIQYLSDAQQWMMDNKFVNNENMTVIEDPGWSISTKELNQLVKQKNPKAWEDREIRSFQVDRCAEMKLDWKFNLEIVNYDPYISFVSSDKRDKLINIENFNRFFLRNNQSLIVDKLNEIITGENESQLFKESNLKDQKDRLSLFLDNIDEINDPNAVIREIKKINTSILISQNLEYTQETMADNLTECVIKNDQLIISNLFTRNWEEIFPNNEFITSIDIDETLSSLYILHGRKWMRYEWLNFQYNGLSIRIIGKQTDPQNLTIYQQILKVLESKVELQNYLMRWTLDTKNKNRIQTLILSALLNEANGIRLLSRWKDLEPSQNGINFEWILENFDRKEIISNPQKFKDIIDENDLISLLLEDLISNLRKKVTINSLDKIVETISDIESIEFDEALMKMQNNNEIKEILETFVEDDKSDLSLNQDTLELIINLENCLGTLYPRYLDNLCETISTKGYDEKLDLFTSLINHAYDNKSGRKLLERIIDEVFPVLNEGWLFTKPPNLDKYHILNQKLDPNVNNSLLNILDKFINPKPIREWNKGIKKKFEEKFNQFDDLFLIYPRSKKLILENLKEIIPYGRNSKETNQWLEILNLFHPNELKSLSSREILLKCDIDSLNSSDVFEKLHALGINQNQIEQHVKREQRQSRNGKSKEKQSITTIYVDGPNIARDQLGRGSDPDVGRFQILIDQIKSNYHVDVLIVISAKFWRDISEENKPELEKLQKGKLLMTAPAFRPDDHFAITSARENNGYVMSNDAYRDWIANDKKLKKWLDKHRITCAWNQIENNFTIGPNISKLSRRNDKK